MHKFEFIASEKHSMSAEKSSLLPCTLHLTVRKLKKRSDNLLPCNSKGKIDLFHQKHLNYHRKSPIEEATRRFSNQLSRYRKPLRRSAAQFRIGRCGYAYAIVELFFIFVHRKTSQGRGRSPPTKQSVRIRNI